VTPHLSHRPPAREAGPELLVLARWEEHTGWLFQHTARWPRSARFTLCRRVQELALEVAELLVVARYEPRERARALRAANLLLERMRLCLRLARAARIASPRGFESAVRGIDEVGRMLHGWREALG
jgi:hypothetical protein